MSRQAQEEMQPLVPPRYANVASSSLYDPDLPNSLKVVLGQIEGLAWQNKSRETPPLTVYELACICNLGVRQMWRNLDELEARGWLTVKRQRQWRMVLQTRLPPEPGSESASEQPVFEANLAALAEFGVKVSESLARQVAALPHVTPDLICAWGRTMQARRGVRNLPGLLLHMLQVTDGPPRPGKDLRPGSGIDNDTSAAVWQAPLPEPPPDPVPAEDQVGPSPASLPDDALPAALRQVLRDLGWEDDFGEVVRIVARDKDEGKRVWAWVRHVEQNRERYTNPAGFLRTVLRGDNWPKKEPVLPVLSRGEGSQSKEEPDEQERGQSPWGENIGDRLEVV